MGGTNGYGDVIDCAFAADDNYVQHMAVAITSLAINNPAAKFRVHIVGSGFSGFNRHRLEASLSRLPNVTFRLYGIDAASIGHFRLDHHISLASYFRLFLADLLPDDVDRLLFLDSDIIVRGDIRPLWATDLGSCAVGAVVDPFVPPFERLGLPSGHRYFNAGILVIPLDLWRSERIGPKLVAYAEGNMAILKHHDQDVLNVMFHGRVKLLDPRWNFQAKTRPSDAGRVGVSPAVLKAIHADPAIVHFTTAKKPWLFSYGMRFKRDYFRYLRMTEWRDYREPDRNLIGLATRLLPGLRDRYRKLKSDLRRRRGNGS